MSVRSNIPDKLEKQEDDYEDNKQKDLYEVMAFQNQYYLFILLKYYKNMLLNATGNSRYYFS
jgi:hypothetical protein